MLLFCRAAGDPGRPGREVQQRHRRSPRTRRKAANPGGAFHERHRRHRHPGIRCRWACLSRGGALSGQWRGAPGRRAAGARRPLRRPHLEPRRFPATPFSSSQPSLFTSISNPDESTATYPVALGLMADVRTFVRQVLAELETPQGRRRRGGHSRKKWLERHRRPAQGMGQGFIAPGFPDNSTPIHPQRAAAEIDKALPDDAIMVSDIGVHHNWLLQFCKTEAATVHGARHWRQTGSSSMQTRLIKHGEGNDSCSGHDQTH